MSQQYMYFLNEEKDKAAIKTLIHKLSNKAGPGAIIKLNGAEFDLIKNMVVIPIGPPVIAAPIPKCEHDIPMDKTCIPCGRFERAQVHPDVG